MSCFLSSLHKVDGCVPGVTLTLALSRQGRGDKSRADLFDESLTQDTRRDQSSVEGRFEATQVLHNTTRISPAGASPD